MSINWLKEYEGLEDAPKAQSDIKKAFLLNPELPELKTAKAIENYMVNRKYDIALKTLHKLKEEFPNKADLYAYTSFILRRQGKWEKSINEMKLGLKLDPFNAWNIDNLIETYDYVHKYDEEIELTKMSLSLIPDFKIFNQRIFTAYLNKSGDLKSALKESGLKEEDVQYDFYYFSRQKEELIELINKNNINRFNQFEYRPKTFILSLIYYLSGNKSLSKTYADSTIIDLNNKLKETPDDERLYATLGKCYAFSEKAKEALICGDKLLC